MAGQQHGLVVLDGEGRPLRPATLWNDTRSAPDAARLTDLLGGPDAAAARIGSVPVASLTATSWLWLRRVEPEIAARVAHVRLPHDYMTERLSGAGVTDRGDASGTAWWSPAREAYDDGVLELIELDRATLPRVLGPRETAGEATADALALGLPAGALVACGTGDNMGAALGLGVAPGVPVVSLGTSGTAFAVSTTPTADGSGVVAGFADASGRYLPLACTLNCTLAIDRIAAWLELDREAVEPGGEVVVLPFLDGERTPNRPHASGTITGLRHATTPGPDPARRLRGRRLLARRRDRRATRRGLGSRRRRADRARRRRQPRARLAGHDPAALGPGAARARTRRARRARRGRAGGRRAARRAPDEVARGWNTMAGTRPRARAAGRGALARIRSARERSLPLDG